MYIGNTLWGENGLHAFGNNSTESEPDETWNSVSQMGGGWPWQILGAIRAVASV